MRKRVLLAVLAGAALLVAPVAGVEAKPDGDGSKKCLKTHEVGFKVKGTVEVGTVLTVDVIHANRHARDWLTTNDPTFDISGVPADRIKFIGVTDDATPFGVVGFEDAVGDLVKLKAKLVQPKHGCEGPVTLVPKKIKVKATETD